MDKIPEKLFAPERLPRRDDYGHFVHPDMSPFLGERDWEPVLQELGFDEQVEVFMDAACRKRFRRQTLLDCSWWIPMPPEGRHWRLLSILALDDDLPVALFVRHRGFSDQPAAANAHKESSKATKTST